MRTMTGRAVRLCACGLVLLAAGCDSSSTADAGDSGQSSGMDAASDSGPISGMDSSIDAVIPLFDGAMLDSTIPPLDGGVCDGPPGLYEPGSCNVLINGVRAFQPRFALWTDGAQKERFVYLPPGTEIDTSDPDRWIFPTGTRFYKTFALGGVRLETRLLEKVGTTAGIGSWTTRAFAWNAAQNAVTELTGGASDVLGTTHDIPSRRDCVDCHSETPADASNGFSALQLNHDLGGVTLQTLLDEGWLSVPIARAAAVFPGDTTAQAALGYLHANCGNCHGGCNPVQGMSLWVLSGTATLNDTTTWQSAVDCSAGRMIEGTSIRIVAGNPDQSMVVVRMNARGSSAQMPPLGTEQPDPQGIAAVRTWISGLAPTGRDPRACDAPRPASCP